MAQQRAALQDTLRVAEEAANANPGTQAALAAVETARKAVSDFEARVLASATVGGVQPSAPPAGGASSSSGDQSPEAKAAAEAQAARQQQAAVEAKAAEDAVPKPCDCCNMRDTCERASDFSSARR